MPVIGQPVQVHLRSGGFMKGPYAGQIVAVLEDGTVHVVAFALGRTGEAEMMAFTGLTFAAEPLEGADSAVPLPG